MGCCVGGCARGCCLGRCLLSSPVFTHFKWGLVDTNFLISHLYRSKEVEVNGRTNTLSKQSYLMARKMHTVYKCTNSRYHNHVSEILTKPKHILKT